jgi:hypothetical protein
MPKIMFFIIPRGRTGGTLLATMLNAHPQISMGYEMYPHLLLCSNRHPYCLKELVTRLNKSQKNDNELWVKSLEQDNFRVFASRARRSGIEPKILLEALRNCIKGGGSLTSLDGRLDFIDILLELQASNCGKQFVGSKMRVDPEDLHRRHPKAIYLMMVRDGRDVLDSRLKVGKFNTSPNRCAQEWCADLLGFEEFLKQTGANGCFVSYEKLVANPKEILTSIMGMASLPFDPIMVDFTDTKQPLFTNSHGHLSSEQLSKGLNDSSVGRWRNGLTKEEVDSFMEIAEKTMFRFGYIQEN